MSVNSVMIMGRLGKDVEIRRTQTGKSVSSFSIGCSEKYTDKNGQKQENTEWVRCTAWEKTADIISKYFKKGDGIFIQGKFKTDVIENNGAKTYHSYVLVETFSFPEGKSQNNQQQNQGYQQPQNQNYQQSPTVYQQPQMPNSDDLPF